MPQNMNVSLKNQYVVHAIMTNSKGIRTKVCRGGLHPDLIKSSIYKDYPKSTLSDIKIIDQRESAIPWDKRIS